MSSALGGVAALFAGNETVLLASRFAEGARRGRRDLGAPAARAPPAPLDEAPLGIWSRATCRPASATGQRCLAPWSCPRAAGVASDLS
ncbi:MAG: hypothetical protein M5R42_09600 [Rhodocyclaceae bacterium]|nr:hypothetical protein [Rhodocyclaceae bacterium]